MNFDQLQNLPSRVFSQIVQSDNLRIDEENQAITCIAQYVASVSKHIEEKKITMIEIKPKRQTKPPKKTQNKRRFIYETKTWGVNEAKFKAAELCCKKKGWDFKILTEDHILAGHKQFHGRFQTLNK